MGWRYGRRCWWRALERRHELLVEIKNAPAVMLLAGALDTADLFDSFDGRIAGCGACWAASARDGKRRLMVGGLVVAPGLVDGRAASAGAGADLEGDDCYGDCGCGCGGIYDCCGDAEYGSGE